MGTFTILTVCTGNVCRSPLGEQLLALGLEGLPVTVASAGTGALVDEGMPAQSLRIARGLGVLTPETHRARQITADMIREADLVLGMAREHRRQIVALVPRASRYTFTIREFARIAENVPTETIDDLVRDEPDAAERMRLAVEEIGFSRGTVPPAATEDGDDVIDPYRRSDDVFELSAQHLSPAVATTVALLRRAADLGRS